MHAVEAHAEQMLDLLCCTPSVPAGRLTCTRDSRQARDGYGVADWINGAGLSQLAHGELAMTRVCVGRGAVGQLRFLARM